jgi:Tol biopolymer transport system component
MDRRNISGNVSARRCAAAMECLEGRRLLSVSLGSQSSGGAVADLGAGSIQTAIVQPAVSDDGRFVVFASEASNLAPGDSNAVADLFVRDRTTNETKLVSAAVDGSAGDQASGDSNSSLTHTGYAISGNGRYVAFLSAATNLISGQTDTNGLTDLFVRDLQGNTTSLVTATPGGTFSSASNVAGVIGRPAISDDGRFIAFVASYSDLDANAGDADDNATDVFVRDMTTGTTKELSRTFDAQVGSGSVGAAVSISSDGRYVAFSSNDKLTSNAPDFPVNQAWVYDTTANTVVNASVTPDGSTFSGADSFFPQISGDGRSVIFLSSAGDLISGFIDSNGDGGGANGLEAADLFLRDLDTNTTTLVSHDAASATTGASDIVHPGSISADGRFVSYISRAKNLVSGITDNNDDNGNIGGEDAFFFDATTGQTRLLSLNAAGTGTGDHPTIDLDGNTDRGPVMSDDGRFVVFASDANDLVASDTNMLTELFVRDTTTNTSRRLFEGLALPAGGSGVSAAIASNGTAIAFVGNGQGIVGSDLIGQQVFIDNQERVSPGGGGGGNGGGEGPQLGTLVPTVFTELKTASFVTGARVKGAAAIVTITNTGDDFNGPVTVGLFGSLDNSLDTNVDAQITTLTKKLKIAAAQSKTVRLKISMFPSVADGDYTIFAQVSNPTAGTGASTNDEKVTLAAPYIDLSPTAFGAFPTTPLTRGKRARLSLTVLNSGNVNAKATVPVTIAISSDPSGAGATTIATVNVKVNLKPAATKTLKLNFTVPADAATGGALYVVATLDPANVVPEKNDSNNTLVSSTTLSIA